MQLPGDWRQLCIQAARIHARGLDMQKPLWEMYILEGVNNAKHFNKGSFALIFKIHHALIDGGAFGDLLSKLMAMKSAAYRPIAFTVLLGKLAPKYISSKLKALGGKKNRYPSRKRYSTKKLDRIGSLTELSLISPPSTASGVWLKVRP